MEFELMGYDLIGYQSTVLDVFIKFDRNNKDLSSNAFCELVCRGLKEGPYTEPVKRTVMDLLKKFKERPNFFIGEEKEMALQKLFNRAPNHTWEDLADVEKPSRMPYPCNVSYKEFDVKRPTFERLVTEKFEEGCRMLRDFRRGPNCPPIYVDTENAYTDLPHGGNIALLTFCDTLSHTILLWRTHELSARQMAQIQDIVCGINERREFVSFGEEEFFDDIGDRPLFDLQATFEGPRLRSLKDVAWECVGLKMQKTETMSNWSARDLREEQIQYAAMDALVLHYIDKIVRQ